LRGAFVATTLAPHARAGEQSHDQREDCFAHYVHSQ
jgi:hypothetical protein